MRAYFYRYVMGLKEGAESEAIKSGKALHAELATYLTTGTKHLSSLALSGLHIVPDPGSDLKIEASINDVVSAANVPIVGQLDCAHNRGTNKGGSDILETRDPRGTVEVIDWKWKGDGKKTEYILEPNELVKTIQMAGYAIYASMVYPNVEHVRLSHGYFFKVNGRPRKVTKLHTLDQPLRTWEYVESLAHAIKDVVKEPDVNKVDANIHSCKRYGGCMHRSYCTAYKIAYSDQTSKTLFGETLSTDIKETFMGLMQNFPSGQTPAPLPQVTIDLKQQLQIEEDKLRQQATQVQSGVTLDFAAAWKAIETSGRGYPALSGRAAVQRAALVGQTIPAGATLSGAGDLISISIEDPAHVISLGVELSPKPVAPPVIHVQHHTLGVLPPDAPKSDPTLAAMPMPGYTMQVAPPAVSPLPFAFGGAAQMVPVQPPAPPVAMQGVSFAGQPVFTGTAAIPTPPVATPKKRGRPPKVQPPAVGVVATHAAESSDGELEVYVDCIPNGPYTSINGYVEHLLQTLCSKFIPKDGLQDVRCAPKDSALGFGGWKGAVRAIVIEMPPPDDIYTVDTRGNEVMEIIADALLQVSTARETRYVRSTR